VTEGVTTPTESDEPRSRGWLARIRRDERGLALVWMTMFLMVLLATTALAIDIGRGYMIAQRAQNAADSAALAGTIYLPTDVTTAYSTAQTVAASDGFTNGVDSVTVTPAQQTTVSRLKVTVKQTVSTWFAKAIGWKTMTIARSSIADYRPPVSMGSPSAQYGNDPESSGTFGSTSYPNFWGHVAGPASYKENGDAYASANCNGADSCSSPPPDVSCGYSGMNSDFSCDGYYYTVHVPTATSALKLQAFDPGKTGVGDSCGTNDDNSNLTAAQSLASWQVKGWPSGVTYNASTRYKPVSDASNASDGGWRYCTGDHVFDSSDWNFTTTYKVFGPATVPGDPTSAPATPLCTKSYPTFYGDIAAGLQSSTKQNVYVNGVLSQEYLGQYFRQWDNLCPSTINASASDYFIEVQTDLTPTGASTFTGKGGNRFALRATGGTNVGIYGSGQMGIYANVGGNVATSFYLARVLPGDAGHTLSVSLFDIGDGSSSTSPGTLTIVPPSDGTNNGSTLSLSGCTMQLGVGASSTATSSGCAVTNVTSAGFANKWLTVNVPIPTGYSCSVATTTNCWFRIKYQFTGYIDDTTSWTASMGGDPVRIVG
jgi:Flp pilus assembly protein TadG